MMQTPDGRWVDAVYSPEGVLKQTQEQHDQPWDAWWSTRSPADKERLEQAQAALDVAKRNVADNDRIRKEREAKAQAERDARQAEEDAKLEQELEPVKRREMHRWLAEHPGKDEKDFLRYAWPHLKANLVEDQHRRLYELARERMWREGRCVL